MNKMLTLIYMESVERGKHYEKIEENYFGITICAYAFTYDDYARKRRH